MREEKAVRGWGDHNIALGKWEGEKVGFADALDQQRTVWDVWALWFWNFELDNSYLLWLCTKSNNTNTKQEEYQVNNKN